MSPHCPKGTGTSWSGARRSEAALLPCQQLFGQRARPSHRLNTSTARCATGIDFGTARSGYAFAVGTEPAVQLQFSWPGELIQQAKTLTALLYDTVTWRPIAWGMEAYKQ